MLNVSEHPSLSKTRTAKIPVISEGDDPTPIERSRMEAWLATRINSAEPHSEIVTLTPVLAGLLLERNKENRPISEQNLDRLKSDLLGGRFRFNGEAIVVSSSGDLNDGQHRCRAVFETGKSIRTTIVFGPDRDSRMTLDQGVARTVGHYLTMAGFTDANNLAAVAGHIWQYRTFNRISKDGRERPTKSQALDVVNHYRDATDSVARIKSGFALIPARSVIAFAHWAFARVAGPYAADDFILKLGTGAELSTGSPILYCRNRLLDMRGQNNPGPKAEILFRCWNAWRRGDTISRIPLQGGRLPELEK